MHHAREAQTGGSVEESSRIIWIKNKSTFFIVSTHDFLDSFAPLW